MSGASKVNEVLGNYIAQLEQAVAHRDAEIARLQMLIESQGFQRVDLEVPADE